MNATGPAGAPSSIELASGVRQGRVSAMAVLEDHLARIAENEPQVHAFNFVMEAEARAASGRNRPSGG